MTPESAHELLMFHACVHPNVDDIRWEQGFLGMLRPYRKLREENFHSVMRCLRTLAPTLESASIDRETIYALWAICHLSRAWGVAPDGMLRSNNLISEADIARLEGWIEQISYATFCILDGQISDAFHDYDNSHNSPQVTGSPESNES